MILVGGLVLSIVLYFIIVTVIGWLTGARPCKDCAREKVQRGRGHANGA